ncbi:MAG: hypothetical protein V4710_05725 [Verrucomicrobiota bacterium]
MTKKSIAKFCALATTLAVIPSASFAGTESGGKEARNIVEVAKEPCITGDLGVNFVSEYVSRGLVFERKGVLMQPYADLYFKLHSGDGFINQVSFNLGLWSSIHSYLQPIPGNSKIRSWYELDYTAGIAVTFAKNFSGTLSYFEFMSPSNSFNTSRNINFNLAYDDTDLLGKFGKFALHPHLAVLRELEGSAGLQANGWYFEVGIAPSLSPCKGITFTVPITAGFGDDNFYAGDTFGYVSAGINAAVPLSFVPSGYGAWTLNAGYTYIHQGDNAAAAAGTGDDHRQVFHGGVALTF